MLINRQFLNRGLIDEGVKSVLRRMLDYLNERVNIAAAGSNQATAALLTGDVNIVSGADNAKGVVLPAISLTTSQNVTVVNASPTASLLIYPASGGKINALSTDAALTLGPNQEVTLRRDSAAQWYCGTFTNVTTSNVGTAQSGVTAVEYSGDGQVHKTVLTLNTALPAIAGGAALGVGKKVYAFPAGAVQVLSSQINVAITQTQGHINTDQPKVGLGSVVASGVVSALNGTAAFMDILTQQTAADCNGTATLKTAGPTSPPYIQEAAGSHDVFFNAAATWSASGDAAAALTGTITLDWIFIG